MEYIGDYNKPASLIKDLSLENPNEIFLTIIQYIKIIK